MQLSESDQRDFPAFTQYVRYAFPKLETNGAVVRAVRTHGELSAAEFKKAVTWGEPPLIKIVDGGVKTCAGTNGWYGCTRNTTEIEVDLDLVKIFEKKPGGKKGTDTNKAGKKVYVVGATILHELCHWGLNVMGVAEKTEAGDAFETALYGKGIW